MAVILDDSSINFWRYSPEPHEGSRIRVVVSIYVDRIFMVAETVDGGVKKIPSAFLSFFFIFLVKSMDKLLKLIDIFIYSGNFYMIFISWIQILSSNGKNGTGDWGRTTSVIVVAKDCDSNFLVSGIVLAVLSTYLFYISIPL